MRGALWDFNRFLPGKPCQKRLLLKMWFLIFIRLSMKASPEGRLIVTQDPCFLKPRESAISHAPLLRARGSVRRASGFVLTGS